ncbi:MAG TPA: DNA methyltransferase [Polaromonas sp.]|uniref:class I SAM-dependent DNA methyltransferase n=1 Tax=Polaromonas sp. TaxID=1869339 RepID=UPI002D428B38|nr:DNA methyltransferase [Polaromonas sp.]HYW58807.1 DNA methyltransferase [Polaromonas sp.]
MHEADRTATDATVQAAAFVERWQGVTASELSTAQSFVRELCDLLGVDVPHATPEQNYMFERPITFRHGDGTSSAGRIDCYRRGHFVLEAKKLRAASHTKGFDDALLLARSQAESYARALPSEEGRPPFLLVVDVGNVIELYAEFTRSGATYTPFPDPRSHRIALSSLLEPAVRQRLQSIWTDPESLNPTRASARVTRQVATQLAELAKSLEQSGHRADHVAAFLTRCLFSMFAEDVELLPKFDGKGGFLNLLQTHREHPANLQQMLRVLWADMDRGGFSAALATQVLKFNGKLFKESGSTGYSLLLNPDQIERLINAAKANWREVEPAIFGTLLERALDPTERHALGAHYTPRAYVERLVLPTVVEPLRADWANAQAAALVLAKEAVELSGKAHEQKMEEARAEVRKFHHQLCTTRVLDPACGSGNFLYVTLEHLKRLEGEVLNQLSDLGENQDKLGFEGETVTPQQLLGIELNERAAALAELVLWIGYLQWHIRTRNNKAVAEPVVHDYGNIECRDAVLAWDDTDLAYDADGQLLSRWDGVTFKAHPVTGAQVPDETAQVPEWKYIKPRQAEWPTTDFIVGNPPFIGASTMRAALGDGYVQALRGAWPEVPESADFVMYWWSRAAHTTRAGQARRFGFITTNSLRQTFNRRLVEAHMSPPIKKTTTEATLPIRLVFAIPDHPWVDSTNGAAVRIAMTVGESGPRTSPVTAPLPSPVRAEPVEAAYASRLLTVMEEQTGEFGEVNVKLAEYSGVIHADLSVGAHVASANPLQSNGQISNTGVKLHGAGFIVTPNEAAMLGLGTQPGVELHIRAYRNGRDLTAEPRGVMVIDLAGLSANEVRQRFPSIYQWVWDRVKPERDLNREEYRRTNWWLFGRKNTELRAGLLGLPRYIATVETAKHRTFQFLDASILPDNKLIAIALGDSFSLGVLSSRVHVEWSLATGSWLGVGNDPVYVKSRCFETFPFPDEDTGLTPELRERVASLAEQIDAHRKRQQATHTGLTLTGMYNVLEALRNGRELTAKEKTIHTQGLVAVLKDLHDELDAAVLQAYGWDDLAQALQQAQGERGQSEGGQDELLTRLVALNARRAAEEKAGHIRWLRPAFQNPAASTSLSNQELLAPVVKGLQAEIALESEPTASKTAKNDGTQPWPSALPEQVRALAQVLAGQPGALSIADIEARFKGRGPWKRSLPRILETLEALGRARREGEGWRG